MQHNYISPQGLNRTSKGFSVSKQAESTGYRGILRVLNV
jgi:hypothetical protein